VSGARIVAIDGPAASGKSSTAAAVAARLGAWHLDSGALYRGLTRVALDLGTRDPAAVVRAAAARGLGLRAEGRALVPWLDGVPAEARIRGPDVTAAVSAIAALAPLREWVNARLRAEAAGDRVLVLDGRDIGTDVFPDALLKVFLTATAEARAGRRVRQRGGEPRPDVVADEARSLRDRDARDAGRAVAPLRRAPDAVVVDTTALGFDEQVDRIVALARERLGLPPG
jgi:CMP/dCMP kinase